MAKEGKDPTEKYKERWAQVLYEKVVECQKDAEKVRALGGLYIIGTERHESRRIDNQLRGRSGRQGDPGASRFFLSLEDDLLRLFGSDKIKAFIDKLGLPEGEPLEHPWLSKAIEQAQKKVEAYHFDIRKHLLEYDDVMNIQREAIYSQRKEILKSQSIKDWILALIDETCQDLVDETIVSEKNLQQDEIEGLAKRYQEVFALPLKLPESLTSKSEIVSYLQELTKEKYEERESNIGQDLMRNLEKYFLLTTIDNLWKEHLLMLDHVKESVGLRGYGQKNPLQEYKKEAYHLFVALMKRIRETTLSYLFRIELREEAEKVQEMVLEEGELDESKLQFAKKDVFSSYDEGEKKNTPIRREKIGRNDPCPCGSGKKYKKCCGRDIVETSEEERHEVSQL